MHINNERTIRVSWELPGIQWHSKRRVAKRAAKWSDKVIMGYRASHDFWGRQNCSPPWAPITHAMPLCPKFAANFRCPQWLRASKNSSKFLPMQLKTTSYGMNSSHMHCTQTGLSLRTAKEENRNQYYTQSVYRQSAGCIARITRPQCSIWLCRPRNITASATC